MEQFDVVIVGAGVAGGLTADALAQRGHRVLVLEAGPDEQDRDALTETYFGAPQKGFDSPYRNPAQAPKPTRTPVNDYYVQKGPAQFGSTYERRVGGTTWHWHGLTPRLMPADFRMRSTYGVGLDWPISYDDLEPWYLAAEHEMGVAGDSADDHGSPRSGDFPYPAQRQSALDLAIKAALQGKRIRDVELDVTAHRAARNPEICQGSGSCMPLCPTGAKYEAVTHLNRARAQGAVVRPKSVASRVVVAENGDVSSIVYKTWDGEERAVAGKVFVLAANAMETPRLLLLSAAAAGGLPVANRSGQVGRNLMDHPLQLSFAVAAKPFTLYTGPQSTSVIKAFRDGPWRRGEAAFRIEIFNTGGGAFGGPDRAVARLIDQGLTGPALRAALADAAGRELLLVGEAEQLPDPQNRIVLSAGERDGLGLPRPEIHYAYDDYTTRGLAAIREVQGFVFEQMGASRIFHLPQILGSGHIMGTTRMGDDPATSVVDTDLRCHDHPNLFIVGSGVYPTGATANPTLTIAAFALRLADHLHKGRLR